MTIKKPFKRNVRQLIDNSYSDNGNGKYVTHKDYAVSPEHYLRAFHVLLKDFFTLLDYIEPSDMNLKTYSFRIHELLLRTCIELEANFVAILSENGYNKKGNWNILDYYKVNNTHHLSSYEVLIPTWKGNKKLRKPFENWNKSSSLIWFQAYNKTKHDRHSEFEKANFENLTEAICGLSVLLASQFMDKNFTSTDNLFAFVGKSDEMDISIGEYFRINFPRDWKVEEKYDFNWSDLEKDFSPIDTINYNK